MTDQASELRDATAERRAGEPRIVPRLRCIAVASGKGGVGKTMISVGVSWCLAQRKHRVLLLDADLGLANVDLQMGINPTYTLQDVVYGSCTAEEAVVHVNEFLHVLAAASGSPEMVDMGNARRRMLVSDLVRFAAQYDFLLIDSAAGIGSLVTSFLSAAPEVLVVVANEPTSIMDAYSLIKMLRGHPDPPAIRLAVNMVESLEEGEALAQRLNGITRRFLGTEFPVAGILLYDSAVGNAIRARKPVPLYAGRSAPALCVDEMARVLAEHEMGLGTRVDHTFFDKLAEVGLGQQQDGAE